MSPGAILHTGHLPRRLKSNLAWGLEARWEELHQAQRTGYQQDQEDPRMAALKSDARQAFALGLITYLPRWAA